MNKIIPPKKKRWKNRSVVAAMIGILVFLSLFGNYSLLSTVAESGTTVEPVFNVLCYTPNQESSMGRFEEATLLDPSFNITFITNSTQIKNESDDWASFDAVIGLDQAIESSAIETKIVEYIQKGGGFFYILGENTMDSGELLVNLNLTDSPVLIPSTENGVAIESELTPLATQIEWNSVPEIGNFTILDQEFVDGKPETNLLLVDLAEEGVTTDERQPFLIQKEIGSGTFLLSTAWLDFDAEDGNLQFVEGLYFCYFVYLSMMEIMGEQSIRYGEWEYSPVPHQAQKIVLSAIIGILAMVAYGFYLVAKKKSKQTIQKDYLAQFAQEAKEKEDSWDPTADDWEDIGSHRQISGFLLGFFAGILVLIPQVGLTIIVFPRYIMPYPAVAGMYGYAQDLFRALWTFMDVGTSVALAKYFAQYRIKSPEKAIRYVQIFIWWQFISGIIQMSLVTFLGLFIFPSTHLAHMSYLFIFHSFVQFPGWFQVLIFVYQGMQRVDLQLVSNILQMILFDLLSKYVFILLFRGIFRNSVPYGEVFGAMLGYAVGEWFGQFLTFIFTTILFKKLGFHLQTIFRVDFTKEEIKETFRFGIKIVAGAVLVPAVFFIQAWLASLWIYNYNAELGYYSMVYQISQIISLVNLFAQSLMSGMSESYGNNKKVLFELYMFQGFKWSNFAAYFIISSLAVVMWRLVLGAMGPTWARAIAFVPILIFRASFEPYTWMGDQTFKATERTGLLAISWIVEQGSRVIFLLLLMQKYQMMGILYAWLFSLILKIIYQYYAIWKHIMKPRMFWWQSFIAPGLAAVINFIIFEIVALSIFREDIITSVILFVLAFFVFFFLYSFLVGFLGGWDDNTLREFQRAVEMIKNLGFYGRGLYKATKWGADHSLMGLHNRFPVTIYEEAAHEARELTLLKKQLRM